jgi:phosphatidylglycerophosphate synthase
MIDTKLFQKPKEEDFLFAWMVQRRISGPVAVLLKETFVTPDQLTIISILLGVFSFYFLSYGVAYYDFLGMVLFQCSFLFDCIDGDLARLRANNKVKLSGIFIDYLRALLLEPLLPIFISIGLVLNGYHISILIGTIVLSIWRWMPQFSREHIVVRNLDRNPAMVEKFKAAGVLKDSKKSINGKHINIIKFLFIIIHSLWGLPIGMMNTMTIIALIGLFINTNDVYNRIKFYYLLMLIIIYFVLFIRTSIAEYNSLNKVEEK